MLIVDMNLSPEWVQVLGHGGFAAMHWREIGAPTAVDREIFAYAAEARAIILTQDLDFGAILAQTNATSPSVVLLRSAEVAPAIMGAHVIAALGACQAALATGAILTIDDDRHRVRLLPLRPEIL